MAEIGDRADLPYLTLLTDYLTLSRAAVIKLFVPVPIITCHEYLVCINRSLRNFSKSRIILTASEREMSVRIVDEELQVASCFDKATYEIYS